MIIYFEDLNLKQLRVIKGLSQEEVAKYIGLKKQSYNLSEWGKRKFKVDEVEKMSILFNVPINTLISIIKNKNKNKFK